jgi:hypothetical protein
LIVSLSKSILNALIRKWKAIWMGSNEIIRYAREALTRGPARDWWRDRR